MRVCNNLLGHTFRYVYDNTVSGSPLRLLFLHQFIAYCGDNAVEAFKDLAPIAMLLDLIRLQRTICQMDLPKKLFLKSDNDQGRYDVPVDTQNWAWEIFQVSINIARPHIMYVYWCCDSWAEEKQNEMPIPIAKHFCLHGLLSSSVFPGCTSASWEILATIKDCQKLGVDGLSRSEGVLYLWCEEEKWLVKKQMYTNSASANTWLQDRQVLTSCFFDICTICTHHIWSVRIQLEKRLCKSYAKGDQLPKLHQFSKEVTSTKKVSSRRIDKSMNLYIRGSRPPTFCSVLFSTTNSWNPAVRICQPQTSSTWTYSRLVSHATN